MTNIPQKKNLERLLVTVDKSHLITIGEKLYSESIELIRELINNSYDADATLVEVTITPQKIEIKDDGLGMDRGGLQQYFNIGSQEKLLQNKSPRLHRDRIGQFGIGKFASLAACQIFQVFTQKDDFAARVTFDKEEWGKKTAHWYLPMEILAPDPKRGNGTTVTLLNLYRSFDIGMVEKRIAETVPLKAPKFAVKLNGHRVLPKSFSGHRIPFLDACEFGPVHGEIIILPENKSSTDDLGIEIKVKNVTIKRELLGMERWGKALTRVRGEIHADFLPITSDRSGFIVDSPEYQEFLKLMVRIMGNVRSVLGRLSDRKESKRASKALKEALERIHRALALNPEFSPFGVLPLAQEGNGIGGAGLVSEKKEETEDLEEISPEPKEDEEPQGIMEEQASESDGEEEIDTKPKKSGSPKISRLTPNAIIKRMKFGERGVSCCLDHFGEEGPECFTEGGIIYINRDHLLYRRESKKMATYTMYVARLLTQELALMKDPQNPRQAFERQSLLLKDAFKE